MKNSLKFLACVITTAVACSAGTALADGWGTLTGKIVIDGDAPSVAPVVEKGANVKDAEICAVKAVPNDSLVTGPNGELANCFIYLYQRRGTPDIHPDLKKPAVETLKFDNQNCRFVPHALVVRADQKVQVINSDACGHNVHTFPLKNQAMNQLIGGNNDTGIMAEFNQGELLPMQVKCDIHPWMTAYWMVVEHPYAMVTGDDGTFTITKIPEGEHTFRIWHERVGYVERKLEVDIKADGIVDVGIIKVDAKDLED